MYGRSDSIVTLHLDNSYDDEGTWFPADGADPVEYSNNGSYYFDPDEMIIYITYIEMERSQSSTALIEFLDRNTFSLTPLTHSNPDVFLDTVTHHRVIP